MTKFFEKVRELMQQQNDIDCTIGNHVPENNVYLSNPPQYRCKHCGQFYKN